MDGHVECRLLSHGLRFSPYARVTCDAVEQADESPRVVMGGGTPHDFRIGIFRKFSVQKLIKTHAPAFQEPSRLVCHDKISVHTKFSALEMAWKAVSEPFLEFMGGSHPP